MSRIALSRHKLLSQAECESQDEHQDETVYSVGSGTCGHVVLLAKVRCQAEFDVTEEFE